MKIIKVLIMVDILLLLFGLSWIVLGPRFSSPLMAFNRSVSPTFFGVTILLIAVYQGLRLRRTYLRFQHSSNRQAND